MNGSPLLAAHRASGAPNLMDKLAAHVIRRAARRTPGALAERLEEEWLALIPEMRGALVGFRFALGCLWASSQIHQAPVALGASVISLPAVDIRLGAGSPSRGSRSSPAQKAAAEALICNLNTTPLIDVMLVLIVTLIVSLPSMTHAVKLEMARATAAQNLVPPEIINVDVDFDGALIWNGSRVADLQALEGYYRAESQKVPLPQINLRPDRRAPYDVVAKVLAAAQRNGMTDIQFANTEDFR